ncbi:uncharacterized protein L969DRAFT_21123 [Mixia osmundae IAM 14324]|uniref:Telomere length regulation protein conserved domain-containing protein n=1 Tax=Mixia osmundae (strain CBS 9802 / IAM 14324 / JCM 22182 / KY 12970) TaxID=764103 RepID=G7E076_MIXOS|nr:uncharacterized protein L969DRAFT_21123 [Mixia osmundae IAM 14324]KEI42226.1 hypothetical protein L969DRAFT_21123 [Mixia osmundae IAM 14324]GAA96236.1 hypothetical protein E5Q_02900 [Mixia osmundae IAM 14324]
MESREQLRKLTADLRNALRRNFDGSSSVREGCDRLLWPPLLLLGASLPNNAAASKSEWARLAHTYADETLRMPFVSKHAPSIQLCLVSNVLLDWSLASDSDEEPYLRDSLNAWLGLSDVLPDLYRSEMYMSGLSASLAALTALSPSPAPKPLQLLLNLIRHQTAKLDFITLIQHDTNEAEAMKRQRWAADVATLLSVPSKIANVVASNTALLPPDLQEDAYLALVADRLFDCLERKRSRPMIDQIAEVVTKLCRRGYVPPRPTLPPLAGSAGMLWWRWIPRLCRPSSPDVRQSCQALLSSLAMDTIRTTLSSLFAHLQHCLDPSLPDTALSEAVALLERIIGSLSDDSPLWRAISSTLLMGQAYSLTFARTLSAWLDSQGVSGQMVEAAAAAFERSGSDQRSTDDYDTYICAVLVLATHGQTQQTREAIRLLGSSATFTGAVHTRLSSTRPGFRLRGMLLAEIVSAACFASDGPIKALKFDASFWDGDSDEQRNCRVLRSLRPLSAPTTAGELTNMAACFGERVYLPAQFKTDVSRAPVKKAMVEAKPRKPLIQVVGGEDEDDMVPYAMPSSQPIMVSEEDLNDMGTYTPSKKKPRKPIYMQDLLAYLKATEDRDKIELALAHGEQLIRAKQGWGTELTDNAVDLTIALFALQDNFDLDRFEQLRQDALTAIVACCPLKAAPCIIEHYFLHQYSTAQRSCMLTALALGGSELSGARPDTSKALETTARAISKHTIDDTLKGHYRSQRLSMPKTNLQTTRERPSYADICAQSFVMPLINRFWLYMRDAATLQHNHKRLESAGSAMILAPINLSRLLLSLAILMDSARASPHYLAVLAPETLEMCMAIRSFCEDEGVQTTTFELACIVLDSSLQLDSGHRLATDHARLVVDLKTWAEESRPADDRARVAAAAIVLRSETLFAKQIRLV